MRQTNKLNARLILAGMYITAMLYTIGLAGCAAVATGGAAAGATYAYVTGWVVKDYPKDLNDTYRAGLEAVKHLDMQVVEKSHDLSSADIKSTLGNTDYWIKMQSKSDYLTKVSVRSGLLGDKVASLKIHEAIQKAL